MSTFLLIISILTAGCSAVQRRAYAGCPNGWTVYGQSCYITGHTAVDFNNAVQFCQHYQAKLAEIESAAENNFLRSYLEDFKVADYWIGLTDSVIDNEWRWYSDDSLVTFTDWHPTEPNNGKAHNCALIYGSGTYAHHWVDAPCSGSWVPLCELPVSNGPQEVVG
ncbi:mannose binding [Mactra antiquata]